MAGIQDASSEKDIDSANAYTKEAGSDDASSDKEAYYASLRTKYTYQEAQKILRRCDLHVLPILWLMYLVKNLDSNLVSYVKTMNQGEHTNVLKMLGMTTNAWSYTATVFTASFVFFEIPSTILIKRFTPRLHFVRIMALWSVATICTAAVTNEGGMFACRFLLGAFEAGLWPGIIYQLTTYYRPDELTVRLASINLLGQFSGILVSLETFGLQFSKGKLAGWQWAFIVEGLLGFALCVVTWAFLPDFPDSPQSRRSFLTKEEGDFVVARLPPNSARSSDADFSWAAVKDALKDQKTYLFGAILLIQNTGASGYQFWLPTIISGYGFTSKTSSQLLNIPPAVIYCISAIGWAWIADNVVWIPRPAILIGAQFGVAGCLFGLTWCASHGGKLFFILAAGFCNAAYYATVFPWRAQSFKNSAHATFSIAAMISLANCSSLYTAQIFRSQYAPIYEIPYMISVGFLGLTVIVMSYTWWLTFDQEKETRMVAAARRKAGKETGEIIQQDVKAMEVK